MEAKAFNVEDPIELLEHGEIVGRCVVHAGSERHAALVVRRRRPFVPFGSDPIPVNRECARTYAVLLEPSSRDRFIAIEFTHWTVTP